MDIKEMIAIGEKIKNEASSPEEELAFLKFMNENVDTLNRELKEIDRENKIKELEEDILKDK